MPPRDDSTRRLFSYVVKSDVGFAPNPFGNYCTLACCKPRIRELASSDDWVVGTGAKHTVGNTKLVYAMQVTEKLPFEEYCNDPRFGYKIPLQGLISERGDNIYYPYDGKLHTRVPSYHPKKEQREHDTSSIYVLVSDYFFYFGGNAVELPSRFHTLIKKGPGHKSRFSAEEITTFLEWLVSHYPPGTHGPPYRFEVRNTDGVKLLQ